MMGSMVHMVPICSMGLEYFPTFGLNLFHTWSIWGIVFVSTTFFDIIQMELVCFSVDL